ncbi:MAG: hypothetical protein GY714_31825 [Desulfobacterales bacterium]|nr:hypothetical protein [Desulfobacterales bacterium]
MNFLRNIFHYTPIFSILILVIITVYFFGFYVSDAGKGSDAAGRGMAQGYAYIISCVILTLYSLVLLLSLILFFKNTQIPILRTILNCILLSPILIWGGNYYSSIRESAAQSDRIETSYLNWKSIAKTRTYIAPSDEFSFQYSSHCKGTFNLSYIEKIELQELDDGIILFTQNSNDEIFFFGSIKVLTVSPKNTEVIQYLTRYYKKIVNEKCSFIETDNHPFNQLNDNMINVYTFDSKVYNDCIFQYIEYLEEKEPGKTYPNENHMYFIHNKNKPYKILEIIISNRLTIGGPVEQNLSPKNVVDWFQTISFN